MPRIETDNDPAAGRFWRSDSNGFLLNDTAISAIDDRYLNAIRQAATIYRTQLGATLHSLYLRGTVPRGMAVAGVSDLDTLALVNDESAWQQPDWAESAEVIVLNAMPELAGVQFETAGVEAIDSTSGDELNFLLKVQALCIDGPHFTATRPRFRADAVVANIDLVQIADDVDEARSALAVNQDVTYWSRRIAKNLVRAGFALVMEAEGRFTRDLALCARTFAHHHPGQAVAIEEVVSLALRPPTEAAVTLDLLDRFGGWIVAEAEAWLNRTNPMRLPALPMAGA